MFLVHLNQYTRFLQGLLGVGVGRGLDGLAEGTLGLHPSLELLGLLHGVNKLLVDVGAGDGEVRQRTSSVGVELFGLEQGTHSGLVVVDKLDVTASLLDGIKCRSAGLADLDVDGGLEPVVSLENGKESREAEISDVSGLDRSIMLQNGHKQAVMV